LRADEQQIRVAKCPLEFLLALPRYRVESAVEDLIAVRGAKPGDAIGNIGNLRAANSDSEITALEFE